MKVREDPGDLAETCLNHYRQAEPGWRAGLVIRQLLEEVERLRGRLEDERGVR